jgi:lipopolysaccharide/colanic/teichoic acid biosynthesis glycosyltransferase
MRSTQPVQSGRLRRRGFTSGPLVAKRVFDVGVAAVALIVLAPALLLIALLIRLDSPGPVLFSQRRWGKDKSVIEVYKFRSMAADLCDPTGIQQTIDNDPRVTRIGRILRRCNIDELPQLWNILKGDMSLVGPRCHAIGMQACGMLYEDLVPNYHRRHGVRPGLTGLAQMRGLRGPTDTAFKARARVRADLFYIENFSLLLDLWIIIGTIRNEITGGTGS